MRRGDGCIAHRVALASCALLIVAGCASKPSPDAFENDYDDESKTWKEIETQLPLAPRDGDLAQFYVSPASPYRFNLDRKSLALGADGVYRYTLVAVSREGARNVSYEGIRCATREYKIYAIGRSDGTWIKARNAQWRPVVEVDNNRQHAELIKDYLCIDSRVPRNLASVNETLNKGPPPPLP